MKFVITKFAKEELQMFDSYRGLLALLVAIAHINQIIWISIFGLGITSDIFGIIANTAVVIFFFLSGTLITYSGFNLTDSQGFNFKKFFINRLTRIYPTLIFSLVLIFILMQLFFVLNHNSYVIAKLPSDLYNIREIFYVSPHEILKAFFLLGSNIITINGPIWSLVIEWWLYIAALFIFMILRGKYNFLIKTILSVI